MAVELAVVNMQQADSMKKYLYLVGLFLYAMGVIGGIGYSIYAGAWVIAVAVLVLGVMAFPTAKVFYEELVK